MSVLLVEQPQNGVVLLRINRPEARNAINKEVRDRLQEEFARLSTDPAVLCVVITGDEKAFAAGADIMEMAYASPVDAFGRGIEEYWRTVAACPKPVIAAVNGYALGGGCELMMTADIIIAGEGAQLGLPEIRVGILPGGGGTQRLPRAVGKYKALKMMLTAEFISGREASDMGLVSEVTADDQVLPRALELAGKIAKLPPLSARMIKETVLAGLDTSMDVGLKLERKAIYFLFSTEDKKEGMKAFIEKRKPEFKGK
ncbi:MAG: enoyl-CoA hydratase-related protein [Rhodospirillales bacterium]